MLIDDALGIDRDVLESLAVESGYGRQDDHGGAVLDLDRPAHHQVADRECPVFRRGFGARCDLAGSDAQPTR